MKHDYTSEVLCKWQALVPGNVAFRISTLPLVLVYHTLLPFNQIITAKIQSNTQAVTAL